ncbi:phospholipase D-like domain-containing protein [uncultured Ruegeria sp.]|uniref:phospholipase D-like domain-containing protein n=1 Tax=uncultured Ruegeria sp. TaxID=259304 RepID=UPI00260F4AB8|nr:phospholipase D-like domain-containing protein [uncultured Ruegeria sp.]
MRTYQTNEKVSVYAIAGTHVVLLGLNASQEAREGLLGFTIERKAGNCSYIPMRGGRRLFENLDVSEQKNSRALPIQSMMWSDYTVEPGSTYRFRVIPVYGSPDLMQPGEPVEVEVQTECNNDGDHGVFFNRGVAGSQAYARRFGAYLRYFPKVKKYRGKSRTVAEPYLRPGDVPDGAAYKWLSRGLEEGMVSFIEQAQDERFSLRAAVFEFTWMPVLQKFVEALDRGVDVKIVHHGKNKNNYRLQYERTSGVTTTSSWPDGSRDDVVFNNRYGVKEPAPDATTQEALDAFLGLGVKNEDRFEELAGMLIRRTNTALSHNKFIILLKDGEPQQVWTGSTNFTGGGIFGQSNVGHAVRDKEVARQFLDYWTMLSEDPKSRKGKEITQALQPDLAGEPAPGITCIFSPRKDAAMLDWYAERMAKARNSVFFTTAFTVAKQMLEVVGQEKAIAEGTPFQRYLLMEGDGGLLKDKIPIIRQYTENSVAWGDVLERRKGEGMDEMKLQLEALTGLNNFVNFVHTKYMLIDPLSDDPIVITGSANFSDASTKSNDENMLVIRGNTRVADIFLVEFMRLFNHFQSRNRSNEFTDEEFEASHFLSDDDSWLDPYYKPGSHEWNERLLFAGPGAQL